MRNRLLILILFAASCTNYKPLTGRKLYLLNVNTSRVEEIEFNFISDDAVQIRQTMLATSDGFTTNFKMIKAPYSYSGGELSVPQYVKGVNIRYRENGDYLTDRGVTFYHLSILNILGTNEAKKRLMSKMSGEKEYKLFMNSMHPKLGGFKAIAGGSYIYMYPRKRTK